MKDKIIIRQNDIAVHVFEQNIEKCQSLSQSYDLVRRYRELLKSVILLHPFYLLNKLRAKQLELAIKEINKFRV